MVSVIITTYKRPDNLNRAIRSVREQSYKDWELIVVDDNNEDTEYRKETEELMAQYADNNKIIYLKHKQNKNGAAARNTGIKVAQGEYITFLDDDDYYMPNRLEILVQLIKKCSGYDCVYSGVAISESGGFLEVRDAGRTGELLLETLCHDTCWITGSNLLFTANAVRSIGEFDESFIRHQDTEYMCRFFLKGYKILACPQYLVVKNQDDRKNDVNVEKQISTKKHFLNKFKKEIHPDQWKYINYRNYFIVLWLCIKNRDIKQYKYVKSLVQKYQKIDIKTQVKIIFRWVYCCLPVSDLLFRIRRFKTKRKLANEYKVIDNYIKEMEKTK